MEWWMWAGGYVVIGTIVAAIEPGDDRIDPAFSGFITLIWPMVIFGWVVGHVAKRLRALGKRIVR